jgi:hypothetical protein
LTLSAEVYAASLSLLVWVQYSCTNLGGDVLRRRMRKPSSEVTRESLRVLPHHSSLRQHRVIITVATTSVYKVYRGLCDVEWILKHKVCDSLATNHLLRQYKALKDFKVLLRWDISRFAQISKTREGGSLHVEARNFH